MPRKRHTAEEIVAKLRQVEVLTAQGRPVAEAGPGDRRDGGGCATNCSTGRSSTPSRRPGSSSKDGGGTTTPAASIQRSPTRRQLPRWPCGRPRRPYGPWPQNRSCTNIPTGPPDGGRPAARLMESSYHCQQRRCFLDGRGGAEKASVCKGRHRAKSRTLFRHPEGWPRSSSEKARKRSANVLPTGTGPRGGPAPG